MTLLGRRWVDDLTRWGKISMWLRWLLNALWKLCWLIVKREVMESFKVMFGWLDKIGYVYPKVVFAVKYVMLYLYFV